MKTISVILFLSVVLTINLNAQDVAVLTSHEQEMPMKANENDKPAFTPNLEMRATFNGSLLELAQFFEDNLVYPELGRVNNIEGTVLVQFTVAADGSIQDAKVIKGLGQELGFDEEALRLVNLMPKWKPAQQGVRAVNSKVRMPIAFSL